MAYGNNNISPNFSFGFTNNQNGYNTGINSNTWGFDNNQNFNSSYEQTPFVSNPNTYGNVPSVNDVSQFNGIGSAAASGINNPSLSTITPSGGLVSAGAGVGNNLNVAGVNAATNQNQPGGFTGVMNSLGGLQGIASLAGSIGGIYTSLQGLSLAKKQFKLSKEYAEKNYKNTVKSYNTALSDRARSRAVMESQTDAQRDAYINENKLV